MKKKMIFVALMIIAILLAILAIAIGQEQPEDASPTLDPYRSEYLEKQFDFQFEPDREDRPTREMAEKIVEGMSVGEAYAIMGKPQRDVGSGLVILEWDLDTGEILKVPFILDVEKNDWYVIDCVIK